VSAPAQAPGRARPSAPGGDGTRPARPLAVTGAMAAATVAGAGLALFTTLTAIGWITAPHATGLGNGLPGVLRTATTLWLAAHHVAFTLHGAGRIGMLPLGLVLLPGAMLWRAGRWVVRTGEVARLRHVGYAAAALALPYALLSGALALASRSGLTAPSLPQAVIGPFLAALVAGGLGGARALAPWGRLAGLLPVRSRSVTMGMLGTLGLLTVAGAVLAGGSFAAHLGQVRALTDSLSPGPVGAVLLLLAELAYVPNAVIWAVAYSLGPGFAFGAGTVVAPTGSALGAMPVFPMLAALPSGGGVPAWLAAAVLAAPYLAAAAGGVLTVRIMPTPVLEAAPLWGFASGVSAGCVVGVLAAFAGGPLGNGRLSAVGPSGWQVGLVAILEMGVTAAVAAGAANWLMLRRAGGIRARPGPPGLPGGPGGPAGTAAERTGEGRGARAAVVDENDDAGGHRIYLDPWAGDRSELDGELSGPLPGLDLVGHRPAELMLAGLLGGHRVGAVQAGGVGGQLVPEQRVPDQHDRAEHHAQDAEHGAPHRGARAGAAVAGRPPGRGPAQPGGARADEQRDDDDEDRPAQTAAQRQAEQAQDAQRHRGPGPLLHGRLGRLGRLAAGRTARRAARGARRGGRALRRSGHRLSLCRVFGPGRAFTERVLFGTRRRG
jgi:hypothetical protein